MFFLKVRIRVKIAQTLQEVALKRFTNALFQSQNHRQK
jgi:hypothetical protein